MRGWGPCVSLVLLLHLLATRLFSHELLELKGSLLHSRRPRPLDEKEV